MRADWERVRNNFPVLESPRLATARRAGLRTVIGARRPALQAVAKRVGCSGPVPNVRRLKDVEEQLANFFASGALRLKHKRGLILW